MSSFGSSLVNKSGRKIAPRVAARRKPPPSPTDDGLTALQTLSELTTTPAVQQQLDPSTSAPATTSGATNLVTGASVHESRFSSRIEALPHPANWVVTTPAHIHSGVKRKAPQKQSIVQVVVPDSPTGGVSNKLNNPSNSNTSTHAASNTNINTSTKTTKEARLANIERRKIRRQQHVNVPVASTTALRGHSSWSPPDQSSPLVTETESSSNAQVEPSSIAMDQDIRVVRRRQRAGTPEGSEAVTIVPSMVTMFELASRDRRTGLKSEREKRMRAIDWSQVKRRRRDDERRMAEAGRRRQKNGDLPENEQDAAEAVPSSQRVRVRIVNGEHVFENLRVDRHAIANQDIDTLEEFEAHNETDHFNSHTYIRLKRREVAERMPGYDRWTIESTDKFYDCLSGFGTDFMVITHMFPSRTRRQIKAKFVREERANPERIKLALENYQSDRPSWNLDVFQQSSGWNDFKDPRQVDEELKLIREEEEKNIEIRKKETEEIQRQRRLAGDVSEEDGEDFRSGKSAHDKRKAHVAGPPVKAHDGEYLEIVSEDDNL